GMVVFWRRASRSVRTLRHSREVGFVLRGEIDRGPGYRRYAITQVPAAQVIRRLRELDMSLDEVRVVMEAPDVGARNAAISAHLRRMEDQLQRTRATVRALRLLLDEKAPPTVEVEYRVVGPVGAVGIRDRVARETVFGWLDGALAELRSAVRAAGARRVGADAALFSSELLEDEFGEIVALIPVESAPRLAGRAERLELPRV